MPMSDSISNSLDGKIPLTTQHTQQSLTESNASFIKQPMAVYNRTENYYTLQPQQLSTET
eukprot:2119562-Amphidinium_carterae.1